MRFKLNGRDSFMVNRGNCRFPWKSICKIFSIFSRFIEVKVDNGDNAQFREDVWVDDSSFGVLFLHLYRLACSHSVSISSTAHSYLASISWDFNFCKNPNDWEAL